MSQVKIQLNTRTPEVELPYGTGPLLVSTSVYDVKRSQSTRSRVTTHKANCIS